MATKLIYLKKEINKMQATCPLTNLSFEIPILGLFRLSSFSLPYPIFSLPLSSLVLLVEEKLTEIKALKVEHTLEHSLECKLLLIASLNALGTFPKVNEIKKGEHIKSDFFKTPYSLTSLLELLETSKEVLTAYTSLPSNKKEKLALPKIKPYAISSLKDLKKLLGEIKGSITFSNASLLSRELPLEALTSHSASSFFSSLTLEEKKYSLEVFASENALEDALASLLEFQELEDEKVGKEEVANASLSIMRFAECIDQTSIEEVSLIWIFKSMLEGKKNVLLTRSKVGNFSYWIGVYSPSLPSSVSAESANGKKKGTSLLEQMKRLAKGEGKIQEKLALELSASLDADEL